MSGKYTSTGYKGIGDLCGQWGDVSLHYILLDLFEVLIRV